MKSLITLVLLICTVSAMLEFPDDPDVFSVLEFGAKGDGKTIDQEAITKAFTACREHGGNNNVVLFPKAETSGTYLTGPFNISCNHTIVWIDPGVTILATKFAPNWPVVTGPLPMKGWRNQPVVYGTFVHNVTIAGGGVIDGNGDQWWPHNPSGLPKDEQLHLPDGVSNELNAPRLMACVWCNAFNLVDITLQMSPFWTYTPFYSMNLLIDNITIWSGPIDSPNTDCVDPCSVRNMIIRNSIFSCGDDHITVKAYPPSDFVRPDVSRPPVDPEGFPWRSQNVTIEHNTFYHGQGLVIGAGTKGGIFDVTYSHNVMHGGLSGMRFKTVRDYSGYVEGIRYLHNEFRSTGILLSVNMDFDHHPPAINTTAHSPILRDIQVHNCTGWGIASVELQCLPESPCDGWTFTDWALIPFCNSWVCEYGAGKLGGSYEGPPVCDSFVRED